MSGAQIVYEPARDDLWTEAFTSGSNLNMQKQASRLFMSCSPGEAGFVTVDTWDLTRFSEIEVDWDSGGSTRDNNRSRLVASTSQMGSSDTFDARLEEFDVFDRRIQTLDISALTGPHYIRVHAVGLGTAASSLLVYRVRLLR